MFGIIPISVLAILAALVLIICLFVFLKRKSDSSTPSDNNQASYNSVGITGRTENSKDNLPEDDSLVAILTAAVLASMGNPDIKIRVTSFRRIPQTSPIWNTIGRKEYISNKL